MWPIQPNPSNSFILYADIDCYGNFGYIPIVGTDNSHGSSLKMIKLEIFGFGEYWHFEFSWVFSLVRWSVLVWQLGCGIHCLKLTWFVVEAYSSGPPSISQIYKYLFSFFLVSHGRYCSWVLWFVVGYRLGSIEVVLTILEITIILVQPAYWVFETVWRCVGGWLVNCQWGSSISGNGGKLDVFWSQYASNCAKFVVKGMGMDTSCFQERWSRGQDQGMEWWCFICNYGRI